MGIFSSSGVATFQFASAALAKARALIFKYVCDRCGISGVSVITKEGEGDVFEIDRFGGGGSSEVRVGVGVGGGGGFEGFGVEDEGFFGGNRGREQGVTRLEPEEEEEEEEEVGLRLGNEQEQELERLRRQHEENRGKDESTGGGVGHGDDNDNHDVDDYDDERNTAARDESTKTTPIVVRRRLGSTGSEEKEFDS
ncbi:hypothetical protein TrLO_g15864 [Triparma laevis f. longispina]|uniref:Uncharacterized protein n=1 Tax=Triparma laevis f. longispina TaxID=1714387 RepID=A0A9W7AU87_9STRA|nr:hypothetical protein TrLO_g15864 [Triparma laevis f. longispina]